MIWLGFSDQLVSKVRFYSILILAVLENTGYFNVLNERTDKTDRKVSDWFSNRKNSSLSLTAAVKLSKDEVDFDVREKWDETIAPSLYDL